MKANPAVTEIEIKPGVEIVVRGLRWNDGWEFDCPTAIIAPVFRSWEDGTSLDGALEDMLIDAVVDGKLKNHDGAFWGKGRGWSQAYLRRKYYRKGVERLDVRVRFILDEDEELAWEVIADGAKTR